MRRSFTNVMLILMGIFVHQSLTAQIIWSADFNSGMPAGITLIDNDGNTVVPQVSNVTDAWVVASTASKPAGDSVLLSTSWYDPPGIADDWFITPQIMIGDSTILSWEASSNNASFLESYQVFFSAAGNTVADFMATNALMDVPAENTAWTPRSVNLAAMGIANQMGYIAFRNNANDKERLFVDNIEVKNIPQTDLSLAAVILPNFGCNLTANEDITVAIENTGRDTIIGTAMATYILNGGAPVTETVPDTIYPGATVNYTFMQQADLSAIMTHVVDGSVDVMNDGDAGNNAMTDSTNQFGVTPIPGTYEQGFNIADIPDFNSWNIVDANNDGGSWVFNNNPVEPQEGDACVANFFNSAQAADDWLITPCFDLQTGVNYSVSFYATVGEDANALYPEKLAVHMGTANTVAGMTTLINDFGTLNNTEWMHFDAVFTVPADDVYHVGFHAYSDADQWYLGLDSLVIQEVAPPMAAFTSTTDNLNAEFTNNTPGLIDTYAWDFGDSNTSTDENPMHTYSADGTYNVCLTVTNVSGSDTHCEDVTVMLLPPVADFTFAISGDTVNFADASANYPDMWAWDLADGNTSAMQNPEQVYTSGGTKSVCLTASNAAGSNESCKNLALTTGGLEVREESSVTVFPNPSNGNVQVQVELDAATDVTVTVYNAVGQSIAEYLINNAVKVNQNINLDNQPNGVYTVRVKGEKLNSEHRVVLSK